MVSPATGVGEGDGSGAGAGAGEVVVLLTLTVTTEDVRVLPAASRATAVSVAEPLAACVVFHVTL